MGSCHSFLGLRGQRAQNMSVVEINATRMEREKFFLSLSLSIWALSHWAKQGQRDSTKKTVGQHEERIAVAADACGLDTHGPLCVRSRTVKRPNVQNLKD